MSEPQSRIAMTIRLRPDLHSRLTEAAEKAGITASAMVAMLLAKHLPKQGN